MLTDFSIYGVFASFPAEPLQPLFGYCQPARFVSPLDRPLVVSERFGFSRPDQAQPENGLLVTKVVAPSAPP